MTPLGASGNGFGVESRPDVRREGASPAGAPLPPFKVLFLGPDMPYALRAQQLALQGTGAQVVNCAREDVHTAIVDAEVVMPMMTGLDAAALAHAAACKIVLQFGVGLEGVDIAEATRRGIYVSNVPSHLTGNALSCAEHAIFLALACLRRVNVMADSVAGMRVGDPVGDTLFGKTALVVGFGGIGQQLVPRLKAFGMRVLCVRGGSWGKLQGQHWGKGSGVNGVDAASFNPSSDSNSTPAFSTSDIDTAAPAAALLDDAGTWEADMPRLAAQADVVFVTAVQTPATRGLIEEAFLEACKPGVRIVNVARGGLLDREAIKHGLDSGKIAAMGLDVFWEEPVDPADPIAAHPAVYMTPHVAGVTRHSYDTMAQHVAREVMRVMRDRKPPLIQANQPINPRLLRGAGEAADRS